jgi:HSP20 family molecular chaperone IbpA|uniref:SHSP domain-containing protein n=1 Tax=viral metagenome TaxID=1070528 RepID=A0A6C0JCH1_9ZZZZ
MNSNLNNATETATNMSHNLVDEIHHLGHELINNAVGLSIPIINSFANVDINIPKKLDNINYYRVNKDKHILIICELPGVPKNACSLNYNDGILRVSGHTMYENEWEKICDRKYYKEINVGSILKDNISANYDNGVLKITLIKSNMSDYSVIEIN